MQEPCVIRLSEVSKSQSLQGSALKLRFPTALHPQAVLMSTAMGYSLAVLSAKGVMHALQLPHTSHMRDGESVLSGVLVPGTVPGGINAIASVPLQVGDCPMLGSFSTFGVFLSFASPPAVGGRRERKWWCSAEFR